ncbi:MAG TPA: hypothetical protein VKP00_15020 [Gemmatimonadaceae bacterium]|nr:hypothetical protein [Gemmatimonadaceae bacterium]
MQVTYKPPTERGVTTLMYVGDDDAVEKAITPSSKELLVGALAVIVALQSKGITRLAATGVAGYVGYRAYKARK